jgi:hypothetical protein
MNLMSLKLLFSLAMLMASLAVPRVANADSVTFDFATLRSGVFGSGSFTYDSGLGTSINKVDLSTFAYADPIVGSFNLNNLEWLRFEIGPHAEAIRV